MPLNRLIFVLVTVLALAGGTIALWVTFIDTGGTASLTQIILLSVAVMALAVGIRVFAPRSPDENDD